MKSKTFLVATLSIFLTTSARPEECHLTPANADKGTTLNQAILFTETIRLPERTTPDPSKFRFETTTKDAIYIVDGHYLQAIQDGDLNYESVIDLETGKKSDFKTFESSIGNWKSPAILKDHCILIVNIAPTYPRTLERGARFAGNHYHGSGTQFVLNFEGHLRAGAGSDKPDNLWCFGEKSKGNIDESRLKAVLGSKIKLENAQPLICQKPANTTSESQDAGVAAPAK